MMTPTMESAPLALLYPELESELSKTRAMLQRFPDGHAAWRPHGKSRTLAELATHLATIPRHGWRLIEHDELDVTALPKPQAASTATELLATFDQSVAALQEALPKVTSALLEKPWAMRAGPAVLVTGTRRRLLRDMLISHLIHHRAQLGVYYRLLDVALPGTYGPSADEPVRL
jgi:uncharacterized damage-inducible protein DinB